MSRQLLSEDGFTLTEMLVTMVIMIMVMFALYSIFDMGLRVYSFGNNKVEATENARLGLEKMEREIKAAYPYDKGNPTTPDTHRFLPAGMGAHQITFANDLNGDRMITPTTEQITYDVSDTTLRRTLGSAGTPQAVVEHLSPDDPTTTGVDETGLSIEYLKRSGTALVAANTATNDSEVQVVRLTLTTVVNPGSVGSAEQKLTTDIALRNQP
jgi:prepilin-type N-terminal cleavage/methylation domain-containing protein